MRLAIINLTGGGISGGYKKYLQNVVPRMSKHPDVNAILCASPPSLKVQDWFEPLPNVKFVNCRPYKFFGYGTDSKLNQQLKEFAPDVVFIPTERYFRFSGVPVVNMLQNMGPFMTSIYGNRFHERLKNWIHATDSKRSIRASDRIIAVSKFVRDFLIYDCNISNDKISLIYFGIDLPVNKDTHRPDIIYRGWDGRFLFTAGSIVQYRGLEDVLYAFEYLPDKSSNTLGLIVAGETSSSMKKYKKKLEDWIKLQGLSSRIWWAGNLNELEMAWCYQNCEMFIMTSRVEACPNIALEAMSYGCVSIASNNPPLPEIFGDTAVYYPPQDYKALAEAIQSVLSWDSNQRSEAHERARKRAVQFSWDITAERTVAELAKAVQDFKLKSYHTKTSLK